MEPSAYRAKWRALKSSSTSPDELSQIARQVAHAFIDRYYQNGLYGAEYVELLCEMATSFPDPDLNNRASSALFGVIVEELCDDYEEMPVEIYSRVMSQVISYCRELPEGALLDKRLTDFGVTTYDRLFHRASLVHSRRYVYDAGKPPTKVILLSRVTIGADVAILSVMIQRLMKIFPKTEIVVIGDAKLEGIFGGHPGVRICRLGYARSGGLFERFSSWHAALDILEQEMPAEAERDALLIDPDSRVSQLGVLPFTHGDNYLFFNSRRSDTSSGNLCMAELANRWMTDVFGTSGFCYPAIWPLVPARLRARAIAGALRAAGCRRVVAVNFGVGTNPRKRLSDDFEAKLLAAILESPGTVVLLDRGFGTEELSRTAALLETVRKQGLRASSMSFQDSTLPQLSHGVVGMDCAIGEVAALIAESDQFIGYDSACQHVAAAAKVPTLTIFAGSNNMHFVRRWSACGDTQCAIVHVNTLTDPAHVDTEAVLQRITEERAATAPTVVKQPTRIVEIKARNRADKRPQKTPQGPAEQ
jgi:ADP-heptose:LPS heptosyltransferase